MKSYILTDVKKLLIAIMLVIEVVNFNIIVGRKD